MVLTKETVVDKIEVLEYGHIQVRLATYIVEDGKRIAGPDYHRATYSPGANITDEHDKVKAIANVVWAPEVIANYRARLEADQT